MIFQEKIGKGKNWKKVRDLTANLESKKSSEEWSVKTEIFNCVCYRVEGII